MGEDQGKSTGSMPLLEAWMESTTELWASIAHIGSASTASRKEESQQKEAQKSRTQESLESALKMLASLSSAAGKPETADALYKGMNVFPGIMNQMAQTAWETYSHFQEQWTETAGRLDKRTAAYKFEDLDKDVFRAWTDLYEQEFRKFLHIPKLGLMRAYQERMGRMTDSYALFQGTVAEFLHILSLPMEKSFKVMEEKVASLADEGNLSQDPNDYYKMWIKVLEGHYMVLFKSPDYTKALGNAMKAMEDFLLAREEILQDMMQSLPVPTNRDMDDLYKEIYQLKKRLRELEKKDSKG
ncbi:MAG: poly(R)-hydroxyalkanoic acid synthase subunit PhaE [Desulfatiglandaceae bacterium]|jgi:polyhydroxyalkanoate synthase subunit PhaE